MPGPLDGLRVVELAQGWSGPFCGDGARRPRRGTSSRSSRSKATSRGGLGPTLRAWRGYPLPRAESQQARDRDRSRPGAGSGRPATAHRLGRRADRESPSRRAGTPGSRTRSRCAAATRRSSTASVTPFGNEGPYRRLGGFRARRPGHERDSPRCWARPAPPRWCSAVARRASTPASTSSSGSSRALMSRARTAQGQSGAYLRARRARGAADGVRIGGLPVRGRSQPRGSRPASAAGRAAAPLRGLKTKDMAIDFTFYVSGYIPNDDAWREFFERMGAPELAADPRFRDRARSRQQQAGVRRHARGRCSPTRTSTKIMDVILELGGMAAPYHTVEAMAKHPQAVANDMVIEVTHPLVGELRMIGMPSRFLGTPAEVTLPAADARAALDRCARRARFHAYRDRGAAGRRGHLGPPDGPAPR